MSFEVYGRKFRVDAGAVREYRPDELQGGAYFFYTTITNLKFHYEKTGKESVKTLIKRSLDDPEFVD